MPKIRYYCTYFDAGYLSRGLALIKSMQKHCQPFQIWVLCMDDKAFDVLLKANLPNVHLISSKDFELADPELAATKSTRSRIEYYFTCTPALPTYILQKFEQVDLITYLDADLYFYANPQPVFDELGENAVAITPHRFSPDLKDHEKSGLHNVGWLSFRRSPNGLACLAWWRQRCIEWCYDRVEDGKFADQKYLDSFAHLFDGVISIQHKGVNLALWNIDNYQVVLKGNKDNREASVFIDEQPLIFYHFHGLKYLGSHFYHTGAAYFRVRLSQIAISHIYRPYIETAALNLDIQHRGTKRQLRKTFSQELEDNLYRYYYIVKDLWRGNCLYSSTKSK